MSFFVSRAAAGAADRSQDRGDIFARGDAAVLAVADGAGGAGDGHRAADALLERVRDATLDPAFDLLAPSRWQELFVSVDHALHGVGETTAIVVVLAPGVVVCTASGDSEAWIVGRDVDALTANVDRARLGSRGAKPSSMIGPELEGRLVVASDGLFRHVPRERIVEVVRRERFGAVADALVACARLPSGGLHDDVVVLVAERV